MEADIILALQNAETNEREYTPVKYKQAWLHAWQQSAYSQQHNAVDQSVKPESTDKKIGEERLLAQQDPVSQVAVVNSGDFEQLIIGRNMQLPYVDSAWQLLNTYGKNQLNGQQDIKQGQLAAEAPVAKQQKSQYQVDNKVLQQLKGKLISQQFSEINAVVYTKGSHIKLYLRDYKRLSGRYLEEYLHRIDQELKNFGLVLKTIVINGKSYEDMSAEKIKSVVKDFLTNNNMNDNAERIK